MAAVAIERPNITMPHLKRLTAHFGITKEQFFNMTPELFNELTESKQVYDDPCKQLMLEYRNKNLNTVKSIDEVRNEKERQYLKRLTEHYGISMEDYFSIDGSLYDKIKQPTDDTICENYQKQLRHDFTETSNAQKIEAEKAEKKQAAANKASISKVRKAILDSKVALNDYERKFVLDLKHKRKLTRKQENWLRDIAEKCGVEIKGEFANRLSFREKLGIDHEQQLDCQHEDLGSLGYQHGTTVVCPFCGRPAEVW